MKRKWIMLRVLVVTLLVYKLLVYVIFSQGNGTEMLEIRQNKSDVKQTKYAAKAHEHANRIRHIERVCTNGSILKNSLFEEPKFLREAFYVEGFNFQYCSIPKTGSTAFKQAIHILQHGINKPIYNISRDKIHIIMNKESKVSSNRRRLNTSTVLFSRNPFSRLYSGYIDKVYASSFQNFGCKISTWANPRNACCGCTTFQQFLDYQIHLANEGHQINIHFRPIYLIRCNPCEMNIHTLIRQESLVDDIGLFLKNIGVNKVVLDFIIDGMTKQKAETTIPGVVIDILRGKTRGIDPPERLWKIWHSFHIQGLLSDSAPFPKDIFSHNITLSVEHIIEIILRANKAYPLSFREIEVQRQRHLETAYRGIPTTTIKGIQNVYHADFELFQYSKLPPGW